MAGTLAAAQKPVFVVLEGIDGSGTTTQVDKIVNLLRSRGRKAEGTREPSTGPVGVMLREMLLGQHKCPDGSPVSDKTMALLFAADRMDHIQREIKPLLASGVDVITDRYFLSSLAYQSLENDRSWVRGLARDLLEPDITILVDVPVDVAAERRAASGRPIERYDGDKTLQGVAENYRRLVAETPNAVTIDGTQSRDDVTQAIALALNPLL